MWQARIKPRHFKKSFRVTEACIQDTDNPHWYFKACSHPFPEAFFQRMSDRPSCGRIPVFLALFLRSSSKEFNVRNSIFKKKSRVKNSLKDLTWTSLSNTKHLPLFLSTCPGAFDVCVFNSFSTDVRLMIQTKLSWHKAHTLWECSQYDPNYSAY